MKGPGHRRGASRPRSGVTAEEAIARYPGARTFTFGDGRALCDSLLALVRAGGKTATCGALRDFEAGGEALPVAGHRDIALDRDGCPALAIETIEIEVRRFREVNAEFALAVGETDTLAGWQAAHRLYFERNGGWTSGMPLVCERFRLVEDFVPNDGAAPRGAVVQGSDRVEDGEGSGRGRSAAVPGVSTPGHWSART